MTTGKVNISIDPLTHLISLEFTSPGESDAEHLAMAGEVKRWYEDLASKYPDEKFRVMVDLTNAGVPTKEASQTYIETLSSKRIEKTAFYGVAGTIKAIINFIVSASGKGENVQFFIDKDKAIEWLK